MTTPLADFVSLLLSHGVPGTLIPEILAAGEAAFGKTHRGSGSAEERREKERVRKAAYRAAVSQIVPGTSHPEATILKTVKTLSRVVKNNHGPVVPTGHEQPADGWPEDFTEQFWKAFPPYRRESKRKVGDKLARLRADGKVSWDQVVGAVKRYAATDPGQFACAPMVWLNGERWDREYGAEARNTNGGNHATDRNGAPASRGSNGYATLAARLRGGNGARAGNDAGPGQPGGGRPDPQPGLEHLDGAGKA
jgi:hypothetical protein